MPGNGREWLVAVVNHGGNKPEFGTGESSGNWKITRTERGFLKNDFEGIRSYVRKKRT